MYNYIKKKVMKVCVCLTIVTGTVHSNFLFLFFCYSIPKLLIRVNKLAVEYKTSFSLPKTVAGIHTNWAMMCLKT